MSSWTFHWCQQEALSCDSWFASRWEHILHNSQESCVFHELELMAAWLQTKGLALRAKANFCIAKSTSGLEASIPFCAIQPSFRNLWNRRLIGIGEPHFDYQDPLFNRIPDTIELDKFWHSLEAFLDSSDRFDSAMLRRVRAALGPTTAVQDDSVESPYIDMARYDSWENYLHSRPSNHRADIRRQIRRLADYGTLRLYILSPDSHESEAEEFLAGLRTAYEQLWCGQPSGNLFKQPGTWQFYLELVPIMLKAGLLHASSLRVGDRIVSWHLGFLHRNALYWYKPTYLKDMSNFSPGKVHLAFLIRYGFSAGWREFDFGGGTEEYKYRWADSQRALVQWNWHSRRPLPVIKRYMRNAIKSRLKH